MDELLDSIKKGVKSLLEDSSKEEQTRLQQMHQLVCQQSEQLTRCMQQIAALKNRLENSDAVAEQLKAKMDEFYVWKRQVDVRIDILESKSVFKTQSASEPLPFSDELTVNEQQRITDSQVPIDDKQLAKATSSWPRLFYADSYSNFSPYGFYETDFSSANQDQLYVIEQLSDTEATFIINDQLDFSRIISNYKYGLKAVCEEISRSEHPTSLNVVKPGRLKLVGDVWEIVQKITINIV